LIAGGEVGIASSASARRCLAATLLAVVAVLSLEAPARAQDVPAGQVPVFSAAVENVNVDVFVSRGGRRVPGLGTADFVLTDNGVPQRLELVGGQQTALDVVLALDNSASVAGLRLRNLKKGAHQFVDRLWPIDALTLVGFSSDLTLPVRAGTSRAEAHAAIDRFHGAGATSLVDAVHAALLLSDPARGRPLVLVFSDGADHGSWLLPDLVIDEARASDVVVHYVEAPAEDRMPFLEQLATETGGRGWKVGRDAELEKAFTTALDEFRGRYRLRYEPEGVRPGGWHELKVRLKGQKADVKARRGYRSRMAGGDAR
jgi:VWFA-related protein